MACRPQFRLPDRKALLLDTALASTLLLGALFAPAPAQAQVPCPVGVFPAGDPIVLNETDPIRCINEVDRENNAGSVIDLRTTGDGHYIYLNNSGTLDAANAGDDASGIFTVTGGDDSPIDIVNSGGITVTTVGDLADASGIYTDTGDSPVTIRNSGVISIDTVGNRAYAFGINVADTGNYGLVDIVNTAAITATTAGDGAYAYGIHAETDGNYSSIEIRNSGRIAASAEGADANAYGIHAETFIPGSRIDIANIGNMQIEGSGVADGIRAETSNDDSGIGIVNRGALTVSGGGDDGDDAHGIFALTEDSNSSIRIENHGDLITTTNGDDARAYGIRARTEGQNSNVDIWNSGDFALTTNGENASAYGIATRNFAPDKLITIVNSGDITANPVGAEAHATGIFAINYTLRSPIDIRNSGNITLATNGLNARPDGIFAVTGGIDSRIGIENSGDIALVANQTYAAFGIYTDSNSSNSPVDIRNSGRISVTSIAAGADAIGIFVETSGDGGTVDIVNDGDLRISGTVLSAGIFTRTYSINSSISIVNNANIAAAGPDSFGIFAHTIESGSPISIANTGSVFGDTGGIRVRGEGGAGSTIVNSGAISATSLLAIYSIGPTNNTQIFNSGLITGFVRLDADDTMVNQNGGTFEARLTSLFGAGDDLFRNQEGGTVHALRVNGVQPAFVGLERFENSGLISMVNGSVGDIFTISNTIGGTDLTFQAGSGAVAVDAFLGPPGSTADNMIIDGNVFGQTQLIVNNTRLGGGTFNSQGIPVVFVPNGQVSGNAFFMPQPFDSGLFDWDVYFVPTGGGSGFFELRSFPGGGAHMLPQLLTAAQDIWHSTSETWFDRTADLRVLLNGGEAYGASGGKLGAAPGIGLTPGVWLKGSGSWLEQQDSASSTAYGRTYRYNLDRELDLWNLQGGADFGKKGVWAEGDALLFGVLGGVVLGNLDYDDILRRFEIEGGEVGGYVTYLNGGLFVDTLVKVDFLEFENDVGAPGLPGSLDSTAWGFRTDAGYRFGGFRRGLFVEPLATIAVVWAEIDDFSLGGNSVKFDDEANVRGRLGLRVGSSNEIWQGIVMEPFVIGSLWSNLSGDNRAFVTSVGTQFGPFIDEPDDLWGVVSAGVNFFSPGANTSIFGKVDVAFGDETEGVAARGGMRYNW